MARISSGVTAGFFGAQLKIAKEKTNNRVTEIFTDDFIRLILNVNVFVFKYELPPNKRSGKII
jgi:hypothetical protein